MSKNPPFKMIDWGDGRLREHARWKFVVSRGTSSNHAWLQYIIHRITPSDMAEAVLPKSSIFSINLAMAAQTRPFPNYAT
jgi:type I restriction-modification system DNA methylase subunit